MIVYEADWVCPGIGAPIRNGAVAVDKGRLVGVGAFSPMPGESRVSYPGCAIIPGFVNAHAHLELTIFRGFLENLPFAEWIARLVRMKYQVLDKVALKVSAQLGAVEMLRAGVTTVGEVMDTGTGWEAMKEFGLQGIAFQEVFGPAESAAEESLRGLRENVENWRRNETATQRIGVSPHAPYTVSKKLYELTADFARRESLRLTAHIAESQSESGFVRDGAGPFADNHRSRGIPVTPRRSSPIAYLHDLGLLGPDMLLIHAIEADGEDLQWIRDTRSAVVHCPKSNAKLAHRSAPIAAMLEKGIPVSLGTDSVASNNVVDMFEEMRGAIFQQRTLTGRVDALSAQTAFRMATIDGARCLGLERHVGSLETGKRADFVIVNLGAPATQPLYDPIETLVYSASRSDVIATYVGGRSVTWDDLEILSAASEIAGRLKSSPL